MTEASPVVRSDALHLLSSGVYVLTTCLGDTIHAASVTWAMQVSIAPPLVLVALQKNSRLAQAVRKAHRFALNILEAQQEDVARTFFEHWSGSRDTSDEIAGQAFRTGAAHCPLLKDSLAWIECRLASELQSPGDHCLILGEVTGAGIRRQGTPMILGTTPWSYGGLPTA